MIKHTFYALAWITAFALPAAALPGRLPCDTPINPMGRPLMTYHTAKITGQKPVVDGALDDSCWSDGGWSEHFTQWKPDEGAPASCETRFKLLYDDKNLYVAIRAWDNEPARISRRTSKRDEYAGDVVGFAIDCYNDRRTGFGFDVTAAGQKVDRIILNPGSDLNWNAVWYVKTGREDSAWTAEFEIPLSQLRFGSGHDQTWGLHVWRWIDRLQEESDWEYQSSTGPGFLNLFGRLRGLRGLPKVRKAEIVPFFLTRLSTFKKNRADPFSNSGRAWYTNAGVDAKIGLSSNFTADITVNPDFGQVELDPSVMNLSAFEVFYEEKRPFFLEGSNIFSFGFDGTSLFYSRRIGHAPSYHPALRNGEYISSPGNTTILGAAKITGKTPGGLSLGLLQTTTAREFAGIDSAGQRSRIVTEPLTSYALARVQQSFRQGTTLLGGIFTAANRFIGSPQLDFLSRSAWSGGMDFFHQWHDREFYVDARLAGSYVQGSRQAISQLQLAPARYFQRPDIGSLHFDSTRTSLAGYGGRIRVGKGSKGGWRYSTEFSWRSPGLDFNDLGYMPVTDAVKQGTGVSYFINRPVWRLRSFNVGASQLNYWDFRMRHIYSDASMFISLGLLNKWNIYTSGSYTTSQLDDRMLRGGPAVLLPWAWAHFFSISGDPSKKINFKISTNTSFAAKDNYRYFWVQPALFMAPLNALRLSLSASYSVNRDNLQYIATRRVGGDDRYVLGRISQKTVNATLNADYNITPALSVRLYGTAFTSVGKYTAFKTITDPKSPGYDNRFRALDSRPGGNDYSVFENQGAQPVYSFTNPDFNFIQFRSNLVFRWEYCRGSQIYLVWSQDRTNTVSPGTASVMNAFGGLSGVYPNSVFLVKVSYWF